MNKLVVESFVRKISHSEAMKILDENPIDPKTHDGIVGLITEWGAVIPESAKFIVELGEKTDENYLATIDMLDRGKDGVFVVLRKDVNELPDENIPSFNDIFTMKEL